MKQNDMFSDNTCSDTSDSKTIQCTECKKHKTLDNYTKLHSGKNYYRICKQCVSTHNKLISRAKRVMQKPSSDYKCPICRRKADEIVGGELRSVWHLDHCHTNKKIREWLCSHCNRGLGGFKDDIKSLENAIKYLKQYI